MGERLRDTHRIDGLDVHDWQRRAEQTEAALREIERLAQSAIDRGDIAAGHIQNIARAALEKNDG